MAQLIVRNLEEEVVRELKQRAARHGHSAEEEHRQILRDTLRPRTARTSLKELIAEMPELGEETGFERVDDLGRDIEL